MYLRHICPQPVALHREKKERTKRASLGVSLTSPSLSSLPHQPPITPTPMPPKSLKPLAPLTPEQESLISLFSCFSVSPAKAEDVARTPKQATVFSEFAASFEDESKTYEWDENKGNMLHVLIAQGIKLDTAGRVLVARKIGEGKLVKSNQVLGE